jgi:hypothetical protein
VQAQGAEFLIYDKDHWMDALTPGQVKKYAAKYDDFQSKYDGRYQRGDIVEVREDGFYTSTLKGDLSKWPFRVVVVPGLKADAQYMLPTLTKRRRFSIVFGAGTKQATVELQNLELTDKVLIGHEKDKDIMFIVAAMCVLRMAG